MAAMSISDVSKNCFSYFLSGLNVAASSGLLNILDELRCENTNENCHDSNYDDELNE